MHYTKGLKPETKGEVNYNAPETLDEAIDIASKYYAAFHCRPSPQRLFSYLDQLSHAPPSHPISEKS